MGDDPQLALFAAPGVTPAPHGPVASAPAPPRGVWLGTSSWTFPGWAGLVYAGKHASAELARDGLAAYARHPMLNAVGLDRTYYQPMGREELAAFAEQTPAGFRFLVKAHADCTLPHDLRAGARNPRFLDPVYAAEQVVEPVKSGLGDRVGVVLFQFSPMRPDAVGGVRGFADRLGEFLSRLPAGVGYAVELRTRQLFTPAYLRALRGGGAVHCTNVHPSMPPAARQLEVTRDSVGPLVIRWMLRPNARYEAARAAYAPFDRVVEPDEESRDVIADAVAAAVSSGREAIVVANNKAEGSSPLSLRRLAASLSARMEVAP